jgi:hypothetical protein
MRKEKNAGFASCRHACRLCVSKWPPHQCRGTKRLRLDAARAAWRRWRQTCSGPCPCRPLCTRSRHQHRRRGRLWRSAVGAAFCVGSTLARRRAVATTTPRGMAEGARLQARTHVAGRKGNASSRSWLTDTTAGTSGSPWVERPAAAGSSCSGMAPSASAIALYNLGQHPALSALRPPPSALFSCPPSPPSSPPCASSLEFESPEISPGGLSPRLRARSAPTFEGRPSHAQACQRVRRGLSDAYCHLQRLAPPRAPSYPLLLHPLSL